MLKELTEVFSIIAPRTARHFVGYPIHVERKEISAVEDDRIMADGRPAYAWWNEIQILRRREPELQRKEIALQEKIIVLRIAEWAVKEDMLQTGDTFLRIRQRPLTVSEPALELLQHPERYITLEGHRDV